MLLLQTGFGAKEDLYVVEYRLSVIEFAIVGAAKISPIQRGNNIARLSRHDKTAEQVEFLIGLKL